MAQTMHCDAPGCGEVAKVIISNLETGDTKAYCALHFNAFVMQYCEAICKAQQAAQEEEAPSEGIDTPPENGSKKGHSKQRKANAATKEQKEEGNVGEEEKDGDEIDESREE